MKYGMPSPFYASRLWVKLEPNLRKELDNAQAIADSGLYMAFALYLSAFVILVYIVEFLFGIDIPFISHNVAWLFMWIPLAMFGYVLYRIDIYAQSQYGDMFKAVFDVHRADLTFDGLSEDIDSFILNSGNSFEGLRATSMKIWRYLQWHKVRPRGEDRNYTVGEWRKKQLKDGVE